MKLVEKGKKTDFYTPDNQPNLDFMAKDLAASGIDNSVDFAGCSAMMARMGGASAVYMIPYFDVRGHQLVDTDNQPVMYRLRFKDAKDEKGKAWRYYQPNSDQLVAFDLPTVIPYIHPLTLKLIQDSKELVICEGEKKAMSVMQNIGLPCVGIGGCWNWRLDGRLHPDIVYLIKEHGIEHVTIIPDGDVARWDIVKAYGPLGVELRDKVGIDFDYLMLDDPDDKIDDLIVGWGIEAEGMFNELKKSKEVLLVEDPDILIERYGLSFDETQGGKKTAHVNEANVSILLGSHPSFKGFWLNEDNGMSMHGDDEADDNEASEILMYMQRYFQLPKLKLPQVKTSLRTVITRKKVSPLLERVQSVDWDGVERLGDWAVRLWGCPDTVVSREVGLKWWVGFYARLVSPGCEMGWMLVTTGAQHIGKSAFPVVVSQDNAVSLVGDHQGKDNKMLIHAGRVIILDEMDALWAREAPYWKSMITNTVDDWRAPYATTLTRKRRSSILYGTTNESTFLHNDDTGQRRYGVLEPVGMLDFETLKADLWQMWAEAKHLYELAELDYWQLSEEVKQYVADKFQVEDVLLGQVANYLKARLMDGSGPRVEYITVAEVAGAMDMSSRGKPGQQISNKLVTLKMQKRVYQNRARWYFTDEGRSDLLNEQF